jgi:VWFA-related protein
MRVGSRRLALLTALALPPLAQAQAPADPPPLVVPVGVEIVQVDAVVTDKDGRYVTDLTADDFEIVEDSKKRAIANFRYVETIVAAARPAAASAPSGGPPADVRALAIVIDDQSMDFEASLRTRQMLARFVDERLAPGELVSILRTSGGTVNLQQFTSDKRLIKSALAGVLFNLGGRGPVAGASSLAGGAPSATGAAEASRGAGGAGLGASSDPGGDAMAALQARMEELTVRLDQERQVVQGISTLKMLEAIVQTLARMPGRKSVLFVSEGLVITTPRDDGSGLLRRLREVTDAANRASVVFYTIDPGGLRTLHPTAASSSGMGQSPREMADTARELRLATGLMASETGGLAVGGTNDLDGAVERVFQDQRGYYLLGFEPVEGAADRAGRRRVTVKVKRSGLAVRSRKAFYARTPGDAPPEDKRLIATLASPFAASDVPLRLTPLFNHDPAKGSSVRVLLHVDAQALTFEPEDDEGVAAVEIEAAALCIGPLGNLKGQAGGIHSMRLGRAAAAAARSGGLVLTLDIAVEPGTYQVRAAARDVATGRTGSAFQFVDVPDVAKGLFATSGIVMSAGDVADDAAAEAPDPRTTPAVRRFRAGERVAYALAVYNAVRERAAGAPGLDVQLGLWRDGVAVAALPGPAVSGVPDGPVPVAGALRLAPQMPSGTYTLVVLVRDPARKEKEREAVQQIDFEVTGG